MQASIDDNNKKTKKHDTKFTNIYYNFDDIKKLLKQLMVQNHNFSLYKRDSPKYKYPETVVMANNKDPPLEDVNYMKICGMWTIKHDIGSPKL